MENKEQNVILDSISEGVFTVDIDWRITSFNRAAEEIAGIGRQEAVGKHCGSQLVHKTGADQSENMLTKHGN